jgi:hypothetical protein
MAQTCQKQKCESLAHHERHVTVFNQTSPSDIGKTAAAQGLLNSVAVRQGNRADPKSDDTGQDSTRSYLLEFRRPAEAPFSSSVLRSQSNHPRLPLFQKQNTHQAMRLLESWVVYKTDSFPIQD